VTTPAEQPIPTPGLRRAWWLREALAAEQPALIAPSLFGDADAQVAIIGGGYTGMWTAYFLTEAAPRMRIVLLEADICGGGPSGRNGGFLHGWWESLPYLVERYGQQRGLEIARAADEVVSGIGAWCERHGVDAWFRHGGDLAVATSPAQEGRLAGALADGAPRRLHVTAIADMAEAQVVYAGTQDVIESGEAPGFEALLAAAWRERGFGDFWGYSLVAEGAAEVMVEVGLSIWDAAAPVVLVEEAGGRVTDFAGRRIFDGGTTLATNGVIHEAVRSMLVTASQAMPEGGVPE